MELLEGQVVVIQDEVSDIETDVDFLFDEQIIQDERLLNPEEETDVIDTRLLIIDNDLEGTKLCPSFNKGMEFPNKNTNNSKQHGQTLSFCHHRFAGHNSGSGVPGYDSGGDR